MFSEADVPKYPDAARIYIPLAIGGVALLIVGISFLAVGLNESISTPATTPNDLARINDTPDKSRDSNSTTSEAA